MQPVMREREWAHSPVNWMKRGLSNSPTRLHGSKIAALDRGGIARIGAQIAASQLVAGKQRRPPERSRTRSQARGRAVARLAEDEACRDEGAGRA